MTKRQNPFLALRVPKHTLDQLDELAEMRQCSRTEACKISLSIGIELARRGHTLNMTRFALQIERIAGMVEFQLSQEHGDRSDEITAVAMECVERYHV